jgi:uncharacterized protein YodC (DUF2158 family)
MQVGDVVRMKCGGDPMVVVSVTEDSATCRWPHPKGLAPLEETFPVAALEPAPPKTDVGRAWLDALRATEDLLRGETALGASRRPLHRLHELQQVVVHQVLVVERRPEIRVPHRLLDDVRRLPFRQPYRHAAVAEIMLVQVRR